MSDHKNFTILKYTKVQVFSNSSYMEYILLICLSSYVTSWFYWSSLNTKSSALTYIKYLITYMHSSMGTNSVPKWNKKKKLCFIDSIWSSITLSTLNYLPPNLYASTHVGLYMKLHDPAPTNSPPSCTRNSRTGPGILQPKYLSFENSCIP